MWYWTEEWQEGEREADADIAAGRVKHFNSVDELIADLNAPEAISADEYPVLAKIWAEDEQES